MSGSMWSGVGGWVVGFCQEEQVLYYARTIEVPDLGVELTQRALMSPEVRIYELVTRGVVVEWGLLNMQDQVLSGRAQVNMVLDGTLTVRRGGSRYVVGRGEAFQETGLSFDERWEGEPFRAICVDWDSEREGPRGSKALSARSVDELEGIAFTRDEEAHEAQARRVSEVLEREGLGGFDVSRAVVRVDPGLQRIADAYGKAMSSLDTQPMWCDFTDEVGLSERQLRRQLKEVLSWYPAVADERSFRAALNATRMRRAVALMTAQGATVKRVAEVLGYGSAVAFTNACQRAGLGAPSEFAARAAEYG
jgi:AraC-like DNA-binding protein